MKNISAVFILTLISFSCFAQNNLRQVEDLVNIKDPGWPFVQQMIDSATNKVEVLACDTSRAKKALYKTQVTTRSPMGAIIYKTGGILVDNGWIRILGSGSRKIARSLPDWNKGKSFKEFGEAPSYFLIADDAVGGFFAINGGAFGKDKGKTYYLSPDRLVWEPLNMTYTEFLFFCFSDDLDKFYEKLRWATWKKDILKLDGDEVFNFYPYLWTTKGKDVNKNKRKKIPAEDQFQFNLQSRKQLGLDNDIK
ncbi:MAG: DUF2625 domain-containing protein [Ferruginibacter sp.]